VYKKILVPLDGSGLAECVFEHVIEVAKGCEAAEVDLIYVVAPFVSANSTEVQATDMSAYPSGDYKSFGAERYEKWGKEYLDGIAKSFNKEGLPSKSIVLRGVPADVILNYVKDNAVDLVIMATHGRSGPARWTLGSVADRVLRQSVAPVMIVRPQECQVAV
jgi:nucleotide-binding universal stress UspA family protein